MSMRQSSRRPCPRGPRRGAGDPGASLIEMLLASLMLVMLVVPIFSMWEGTTRLFTRGDAQSTLHNQLRASVMTMVRELRITGYDPSVAVIPGGAVYFEVAQPSTVRFIADVDNDGTTERVEYAYDAAARTVTRQFWRWDAAAAAWGAGSGALVMARDVDGLTLDYFDAADAATGVLANIRRVAVTLSGSRMVVRSGLERYTVRSEARPRNLL